MTNLTVDELPLQSLPDRYGVARSQVFNRIKALGIKTIKRDRKAYVNQAQLAQLDHLHDLIQQDMTIEEAAAIVNPSTRQSRETPGQYLVPAAGAMVGQSYGTGQLELLQALVATLTQQPPSPPINPLARFEQLQAMADHDWRPSTRELADILGLSSLPGPTFERYGFRFTRAGKNGAQTAWKVEKL
ncbi:hypothetical protein [Phormidium sp. FACHB-1136]|uniref:hypothetical protein n=1 Tax=Phormidium sp. FACHB-1136 TaxID=2692848 RepID=UPI00168767BE|nr:hypothetical protein [Phormidium sp. FACHB-1136]MBD2425407.1 hypothetical protein [Phormidium sp. FACHB-1136]